MSIHSRFLYRALITVGLSASLVLGGYVVRAQSRRSAPPSRPASRGPVLLAEAVTVRSQAVRSWNRLSGQVEPYRIAAVSAEVAARITARPIEQGDRVAQGGLLADLDTDAARAALDAARAARAQARAARRQAETDYARAVVETDANRQQARAQVQSAVAGEQKARAFTREQELRQAEAALSQARTDERLARIEADRYTRLVAEGAVAQQTLDRAQATLDAAAARRQSAEQAVSLAREGAREEDIAAAAAQVDTARAGLRIADTRDTRLATLRRQIDALRAQEDQAAAAVRQAEVYLRKHRIASPLTGRVLATFAEVGEIVAPGAPLARLADIRRVKATFAVPESSRGGLRLGQAVTLSADAIDGKTFTGRITVLGYQAAAATRAFPLEVTVDNPGEILLPNMVARLRLPMGAAASRIVVPLSTVTTTEATSYVFVLKEGRAVRRAVTLGVPVGEGIEITRGLSAGETIAATPQRLTDGAAVRLAGR